MSDLLRVYEEVGADGYPPEWHETIKHHVREQAGHRCVRCGHPYREGERGPGGEWSACDNDCRHEGPFGLIEHDLVHTGIPYAVSATEVHIDRVRETAAAHGFVVISAWRILTVHHLDGDKANCRWGNLVALCQKCHLSVQQRVRLDRPWPWPHSAWFEPYVAWFYALKYLGQDLSRDETEARLAELLNLGRRSDAVERLPVG